jgi:hypothetical protein
MRIKHQVVVFDAAELAPESGFGCTTPPAVGETISRRSG